MTSEEMKDEVLSRAAALNKARSRRIKTAAAASVCAAVICAAAIPIYKANRPGTAKPQTQLTVQNAGRATAGNAEKTTSCVTISAPAEQTGQTTADFSASSGSSSSGVSEKTAVSQTSAVSGGQTAVKTEPETRTDKPQTSAAESTAKANEPTTKAGEPAARLNEPTAAAKESTEKANEPSTKADEPEAEINKPTSAQASEEVTRKYAPAVIGEAPQSSAAETNAEQNNGIVSPGSSDTADIIGGNKPNTADTRSMTDIINNDWDYCVKLLDYNGSYTPFKLPRDGVTVSGQIIIGEKSYSFYAELYAPAETDGDYLGTVSGYETSAPCLNSYLVRRFTGIKDENRDMVLISNGERYFIFAETDRYLP